MKIARFETDGNAAYGILDGDTIDVIDGEPFDDINTTGEKVRLSQARLLAPVTPPNVIAIGLNYRRHAEESGMAIPDHPQMFIKATSAVIGPGDPILIPRMAPTEVDYECELCIVIGKTAKHVSEAEALDYVLGYTCGNDVSARDCQLKLDAVWARGKSFDTFCPIGPHIETELDPDNCDIASRVSGETMHDSNTSDMVFGCRKLVSWLSEVMTLAPGTVIMTGTPEGVGFARKPPVFLTDGDAVDIEVAGIGVLTNPVINE